MLNYKDHDNRQFTLEPYNSPASFPPLSAQMHTVVHNPFQLFFLQQTTRHRRIKRLKSSTKLSRPPISTPIGETPCGPEGRQGCDHRAGHVWALAEERLIGYGGLGIESVSINKKTCRDSRLSQFPLRARCGGHRDVGRDARFFFFFFLSNLVQTVTPHAGADGQVSLSSSSTNQQRSFVQR